jgi:ribose 5-phosphate isomerase B
MNIALACDHGGYPLKKMILECMVALGHSVIDLGTNSTDCVDYPDYAEKLGRAITSGQAERGILLCGSGVGACIAANKIKGIYAAVCHDTYSASQGVQHDNMNVLCIGARVVGPELAKDLVESFISAKFLSDEERYIRRVNKIYKLENSGK